MERPRVKKGKDPRNTEGRKLIAYLVRRITIKTQSSLNVRVEGDDKASLTHCW
jgi:hypothetical protein